MIKNIIFIIYMCINILSFSAAAENLVSRDLNQIIASGKLIVAIIDKETPPFITGNRDGEPEGLEVDLARDIARKLELSLDIVKTGYFDGVVDLVTKGKADIGISNLSITCDRAKDIKFTDSYRILKLTLLLNRMKLASLRLSDGLKNAGQLKDTTGPVGVVEGSAYEAAAREYFIKADFKTYKEYRDMINAAEGGEVLMAVGNDVTMDSFLKKEPRLLVRLQPFNIDGHQDHIAMAVGLENDHLLSWLNAYLTVKGIKQR